VGGWWEAGGRLVEGWWKAGWEGGHTMQLIKWLVKHFNAFPIQMHGNFEVYSLECFVGIKE